MAIQPHGECTMEALIYHLDVYGLHVKVKFVPLTPAPPINVKHL